MSGTLSKAAFSALRWNYVGFLARSASNFLIGVLLARLLGPKPFGQLAVAGLVLGVANLLADAGFTSALVQAPTLTEVQIRYVFTVQLFIAMALTTVCGAVAGLVANGFHDPAIKPVLWAMSPTFLIQALGQTSNGVLRRELAFRTIQTAQISSYVCCLLVGVPMALAGAGVWSLVVAQLAQSLIYSAQLYYRVRHSVVPSLDESGGELLRYGSKVTLANMTNWGISNLDNAIVGRTFGSTSLGLYSRAFNLSSSPADSVVSTLQQVLFAACSRAEGRIEAIRRAYLASLSVIALLIFPAFWGMAVCAPTVIVGLYGERWQPSVSLFRPLAIAISINAVMALAGPILNAADQVRREIVAQAWSLGVAVLVFVTTAHYSLTLFAWGVCGVYVFRFVVATQPTLDYLKIGWSDVLRVLRGPSMAGAGIAALLFGADALCKKVGIRPFPDLGVLLALGSCALAVSLLRWGHLILAPQAVGFLQGGMAKMPAWAASFLARCAIKRSHEETTGTGATGAGGGSPEGNCGLERREAMDPVFVASMATERVHGAEGPLLAGSGASLPAERSPLPL